MHRGILRNWCNGKRAKEDAIRNMEKTCEKLMDMKST